MQTKVLALMAMMAASGSARLQEREYYVKKFYDWMTHHNVQFQSGDEFAARLEVFSNADDFIEQHNAGTSSYKMAHNEFSHLTHQEFLQRMGLGNGGSPIKTSHEGPVHSGKSLRIPDSVDWSSTPAVTGVKDQGSCGSCWAFSTTGGLEGAYYLKHGSQTSFSEQQLVSCDHNGDLGCHGGLMDNAFGWIKSNGGLCSESDYPYTAGSGFGGLCKSTCSEVSGSAITSWTDVAQTDAALASAIAQQPVSIAIEADQTGFQYYSSGVYTGDCGTNLDHGVLAVGYGTYTDGTPYWKVKNSWGTSWGAAGYILLERGKAQTGDQCGILLSASYPTL